MNTSPLFGLLLTGGRSRRMQRDKAALAYAGQSQLTRAMALLTPITQRRFVSIRADQANDPQRTAFDTIADVVNDLGPIGGIQAALRAHPEAGWLVLACDLPLLDAATLDHLIAHRDPTRLATAYRSSFDGLPEPLCAIFEPASASALEEWIAAGKKCPRAFLGQANVRLLNLPNPRALDNVNTVEEYAQAQAALTPPTAARRLNVRYFALLREQAGRSVEEVESQAANPAQLYAELAARRGLTLTREMLRVAINDEFGDWNAPLHEGDTVVFLPPVAGG